MKRSLFLRTLGACVSFLLLPDIANGQDIVAMGDWFYQESLDPITDANASRAVTQDEAEKWILAIYCVEGTFSVGVMVDQSSLSNSSIRLDIIGETWNRSMTWRTDRNEPVTENWRSMDGGMAALDETASKFVEALAQGQNRVALRFGHSANTYTVVFGLNGAPEAIGSLNHCK